ncbi:hypothetical protein CF65_00568 [Aggregatibacter actinomycetemcomitans HK1651]|nr:hypothetical protein CF65_00568 [Aggregatibacter actinomycetemcomitans HK1651]
MLPLKKLQFNKFIKKCCFTNLSIQEQTADFNLQTAGCQLIITSCACCLRHVKTFLETTALSLTTKPTILSTFVSLTRLTL